MPEPSIRALRIAAVLSRLDAHRPLAESTAPAALKKSIKAAATDLCTESRRVHRDLVWALEYRGRGAQDRLASDLVDPAAPAFVERVRRRLPAVDADHICQHLVFGGAAKPVAPTLKRTAPTPTAVWLNEQIDKSMIPRLVRTVRARYPVEEDEDVLGMVHLMIAHWGFVGSFDAHLAEGKAPSITRMAGWVGNRVKSALGRRGQDALWRQMRGSRTESEYRKGDVHPESVRPTTTYEVAYEGGDDDPGGAVRVVVDPRSQEPDLDTERIREALRNVIRCSRPGAAKRYVRILEGMIAEDGKQELAAADGCSDLRAGKLTQRVRADLREAATITVADARRVLRYVVDEPFITFSEIVEDLDMAEDEADRAIRLLHLSGYVTESDGRSYAATDEGRCVAVTGPEDGIAGLIII
jgi:hypothetical protein